MRFRNNLGTRRNAFILILFVTLMWYILDYTVNLRLTDYETIKCFTRQGKSLPDILDYNPVRGGSIFFHETSCTSYLYGKLKINARQACAVESAARANPNFEVHLMFTSPGVLKQEGEESDKFLETLLSYRNVKFHRLYYDTYTKGTPIEKIYSRGGLVNSRLPTTYVSDLLRYLTLWRYGGVYLDLDVIVLKSLEYLRPNYAGAESLYNVGAGIMSFDYQGLGHKYAQQCLDDLKNNYNVATLGFNGSGVVTRLAQRKCHELNVSKLINKRCLGFKVYSPEIFYPVLPWKWTDYFDPTKNDELLEKATEAYVFHFWNTLSVKKKISVTSDVPYSIFAKKYCPKVFAQCKSFF